MTCTLIKIPYFYSWYEREFKDLCKEHDIAYITRKHSKAKADYEFAKGLWERGHPFIAVGSYAFVATFGWFYWLRRMWRNRGV